LTCAAAFFALLDTVESGRLARRPDAWDLVPLTLGLWALSSTLWTTAPDATFSFSFYYLACVGLFILCRRIIVDRRSLIYLLAAFLAGCLVSVGAMVVTWISTGGAELHRLSIEGLNANYIGYSLATGVAGAAALWAFGPASLRERTALALSGVALLVGIMMSGCRSALVSAVAAGGLLALRGGRQRRSYDVVILVGALAAGVLAFQMLPESTQVRLVTLTDPSYDPAGKNDLSGRLYVWPIALDLLWDSPLLGIGAGAFASVNPLGIGVHNVFLSVAVELGLVGLTLYLASVWLVFRPAFSAPRGSRVGLATAAMLVSWVAIALAGAWDVTLVAWFGLAVASRLEVLSETSSQPVAQQALAGRSLAS
jgi:O-antigen ligase